VKNLETQLAQAEKETKAAVEAREFYTVLKQHPEYNNIASQNLLREFIGDLPLTTSNVQIAATTLGDRLAKNSVEKIRAQEIAESEQIAAEVEQAKADAVTAKADQIKHWRGLGVQELRQAIRDMEQQAEAEKPAVVLNYSRRELVKLSPERMRELLYYKTGEKRPGVEAEINRILGN